MSSEIAIRVESISKCYHIYNEPRDRLKQFLLPRLYRMAGKKPKRYYREFWALRDVSFVVKKGETIGILGFNGAGKSTLLQIICGTLNPSEGQTKTFGRISALLELGAGFNPEFTGRENVFMSCALYGLSNEKISALFDKIADFSGIGEFIDQPVKFYSSGMYARLAFSVVVHVDPALLIVDEALSVGDMAFQEKSFTRMKQLRDSGTSILLVSHSISAVRNFCDRAIWLDNGKIRAIGERLEVCEEYERAAEDAIKHETLSNNQHITNSGVNSANEKSISIISTSSDRDSYHMGDDITIDISLEFHKPNLHYGIGVIIYNHEGTIISILNTLRDCIIFEQEKTNHRLTIFNHYLAPGDYTMTISVPDEQAMFSYDKWEHCVHFRVEVERNELGLARVEGIVRCEHEWA